MKKIFLAVACMGISLSLLACSTTETSSVGNSNVISSVLSSADSSVATTMVMKDRAGLEIEVPNSINTIVVLAPSLAQTVIHLGAGDKIIAIDQSTAHADMDIEPGLPAFDTLTPNIEQIASLKPDLVLASNLSGAGGENPFTQLTNMGICVAIIPTSDSIEGIKEDISFLAQLLGEQEQGEQIISDMNQTITQIQTIAQTIPEEERKTVYFEIAENPSYSFGRNVFLNEFIELIGATNVLAANTGWMPVEQEYAIASNPDIILTNVNYGPDPINSILNRSGWANVNAVKNREVYYIDNTTSSLPNEFSMEALEEMAAVIYPEYYQR